MKQIMGAWIIGQIFAVLIALAFGLRHGFYDGVALWGVLTVLVDIRRGIRIPREDHPKC